MNGNKYENIKLSIDSSNSYLRALKFLSNFSSKRRTKNKKNKRTNKTKTFKKSLSLTSIDYVSYHKCLMSCQRQFHDHESSVFRVFFNPFLIWLWVCFEKSNVLLQILMSLDRKEEVIKYARCQFFLAKKCFSM